MDFIRQAQEHITSGTVKEGSLQVLGWVGDNIQAETGIHINDLMEINSVVN